METLNWLIAKGGGALRDALVGGGLFLAGVLVVLSPVDGFSGYAQGAIAVWILVVVATLVVVAARDVRSCDSLERGRRELFSRLDRAELSLVGIGCVEGILLSVLAPAHPSVDTVLAWVLGLWVLAPVILVVLGIAVFIAYLPEFDAA